MKKRIALVFLIVGIICLAGGVSLFVFDSSANETNLENIKTSIVSDYEEFKVKVENFSTERTAIYEELNKISYLMDLKDNYESLINEYIKYEEVLKEVDDASTDLKINCIEYEFEETEINNKVSAFIINYEQAINYFIKDVETFNNQVEEYNKYIEENDLTDEYTILEKYSSSYSEYVDINGDGIYNGVEDS